MTAPFSQMIKHWYVPLIIGILYVLFGFWILRTPLATFLTMSILFSVGFFVSGLLEIVFAISNRQHLPGWGWRLLSGLVDLVFGIILMSSPSTGAIALTVFVSFWIFFRSFLAIGTSIELSKFPNTGWGFQLIFGILGVIAAIVLLANPILTGLFVVYAVGFGIIMLGVYHVFFAMKLKGLKQ